MKAAATAGADAAKYQLVYADELAAPDYKHYELFKSLEMPDEVWQDLSAYASELGIQLHLDIFGSRSLELAGRIGAGAIKLHATDLANVGLLGEVARSRAPRVLLGAGGAHAGELEEALRILGSKPVVILLGFQSYPTPDDMNQIARVRFLAEGKATNHPNVRVGFADHAGPDTPFRYALAATAVGAGATVIEKHLTLGRIMQMEDHESALNPDEFLEFTRVVHTCAQAVGVTTDADDFGMSEPEKGYRTTIRRHVVTGRPLAKGSALAPADLVLKRTSAALAVTELRQAYRKTLKRDLGKDAPILPEDIE